MSKGDVEALIADLLRDATTSEKNSEILEGLQSYFNELRKARATLEEKNVELAALNENVARLQANNRDLSDQSTSQISQLEQDLAALQKQAAERLLRIENFKATNAELKANVTELSERLEKTSTEIRDYVALQVKFNDLQKENEKFQEKNENLRKSIAYISANARRAHNTLEKSHSRMAKKLADLRAKAR